MSPTERFALLCAVTAAATLVAAVIGAGIGWAIHRLEARRGVRQLQTWLDHQSR